MIMLEGKANDNGKLDNDYKNRIEKSIKLLVENGLLYLTPGPEGLDKLSPKMKIILENIQKSYGLVFVYSNFRTLEGVELFSKVLDFNGYSKFGIENDKPKYAIYSGMEDEKDKKEILKIFTSVQNKHGALIKILMATSAGAEGLDLKNIRQIHIMEPYWNQMRIEQVIGRGVRRNSHIALPSNEQNVEVFRYFSVLSKKNSMLTRDKMSTDEHIEQISLKKQYIINELNLILKECAFDCVLNSPDIKGDYSCFNFGSDATGFSYVPNISKDIVMASTLANTKTIKRTFTRAIFYNKYIYLYDPIKKYFYLLFDNEKKAVNIDIKKSSTIYIDKELMEAYDTKSVNAGNPIRKGYIKSNGLLISKK